MDCSARTDIDALCRLVENTDLRILAKPSGNDNPGEAASVITVDPVYSAADARAVLRAARADYDEAFGSVA